MSDINTERSGSILRVELNRPAKKNAMTAEANHALGFKADFRDFSLAAAILHDLRIPRVRLLTNNPRKVHALNDGSIEVVERLPCDVGPTAHSLAYLQTKKQKMGHALSLEIPDPGNVTPGIEAQL